MRGNAETSNRRNAETAQRQNYASSNSWRGIPRSLMMALKVPGGRSRLAWRGMVVKRLLAGRHQISYEPAAGRTNSQPKRRSFFVRARYVMPLRASGLATGRSRPPSRAATELPWNAWRPEETLQSWGPGEALRRLNRPVRSDRGAWGCGQGSDHPPTARCAAARHSLMVLSFRSSYMEYSKTPPQQARSGRPIRSLPLAALIHHSWRSLLWKGGRISAFCVSAFLLSPSPAGNTESRAASWPPAALPT